MLGTVHVVFAIAALIIGAIVTFQSKGGPRHRVLGYIYTVSLLFVNISALSVYEESVGMGAFHFLAIISLVTLICGFIPAFLRKPESSWRDIHAYFICWSYVGLVAAGISQLVTMSSSLPAQFAVGLPTLLVIIVGGLLIHTRVPGILLEFRQISA